ncbi:MAG: hypothetical protein KTR30_29865 [Saprospiraceae bacterium]|nr:hypothetical protein [Saprospiraceae bacterium]
MKITDKLLAAMAMVLLLFAGSLRSQILDYENSIEVVLEDGTNVKLFGKALFGAPGKLSNEFYYLPPASTLRLSQKADGTPEFLFVKYTTEETVANGGVQGALIHFLTQWGLTPSQMEDLRKKVEKSYDGLVHGPLELRPAGEQSYRIVSATLDGKEQLITSGKAPIMAGDRAAAAAKMDKNEAQLLAASFEKTRSITDVSLVLDYSYTLLTPAVRAVITMDWNRMEEMSESLVEEFLKQELDGETDRYEKAMSAYKDSKAQIASGCGNSSSFNNLLLAAQAADAAIGDDDHTWWFHTNNDEYYIGEQSIRNAYNYMSEKEIIKLEWNEMEQDERLDVIREAFFNMFLNSFTQKAPAFASAERNRITAPDKENAKNKEEVMYQFVGCDQFSSQQSKFKEIRLDNIRMAVKKSHQMVTNLASTYDQVRHNDKCVTSVNLNDPFFTHRDISVVLDIGTRKLFEEEINDVVVEVRKQRNAGRPFQDNIQFNSETIKKAGVVQSISYAREGDSQPDAFEYKTRWNLRNGFVYEDPIWKKGDWASIPLNPPVMPRPIEFEADLEELKASRISRVTVQIRYLKFGKEHQEEIHVSPAKKLALAEKTIFVDKDTKGYAYRLIINHKDQGKMVQPWEEKVNDNYIYAVIPKTHKNGKLKFIKAISAHLAETKDIRKEILTTAGLLKDQFKDLFSNSNGSDK